MLPELPPTVEGRIPNAEEMEYKARNGRYYLEDVWLVEREFPTAHNYECLTDLPNLVNKLHAEVGRIGYTLKDASDRFNHCRHALHLTMAWAELVREARTTDTMLIVRRTPENSGALLMVQRQEHLRGQCTEMAPLAYIALVRDDQLVVTRDRVVEQEFTERILLAMAKHRPEAEDESTTAPTATESETESFSKYLDKQLKDESDAQPAPRVPNMPTALFNQQMRACKDLISAMGIDNNSEEDPVVEEISDAVEAWGLVESADVEDTNSGLRDGS